MIYREGVRVHLPSFQLRLPLRVFNEFHLVCQCMHRCYLLVQLLKQIRLDHDLMLISVKVVDVLVDLRE